VTDACTVIIGASDLLPTLRKRAVPDDGEVLMFTDLESIGALQAITRRRPQVVALERLFAMTSRGAALINRIKADPTLRASEIRVIAHNSDYSRVVPRAAVPAPPVLDQRGTRRAARFKMVRTAEALLNGRGAMLVDLSIVGAQVVSASMLRPNQRVEVALNDDAAAVRFSAVVAWTSFEVPPNGGPRYRAGINFEDADASSVEAFCQRHHATA
jgi:PilZ domain